MHTFRVGELLCVTNYPFYLEIVSGPGWGRVEHGGLAVTATPALLFPGHPIARGPIDTALERTREPCHIDLKNPGPAVLCPELNPKHPYKKGRAGGSGEHPVCEPTINVQLHRRAPEHFDRAHVDWRAVLQEFLKEWGSSVGWSIARDRTVPGRTAAATIDRTLGQQTASPLSSRRRHNGTGCRH